MKISVGFVQCSPVLKDMEYNVRMVLTKCGDSTADFLVFPELCLSGYLFESRSEMLPFAVNRGDPFFAKLSDFLAGRYAVIGAAERDGDALYNSSFLVGPGGVEGTYRKNHLFSRETLIFDRADTGFPVFNVRGCRIGMLVCFDHMFPEAARSLALQGAEIVFHPANLVIPEYGQLTTRVRAIENRIFWVLANRRGREKTRLGELTYTGGSRIFAPSGAVLAEASADDDTTATVVIDPAEARNKRLNPYNDLFGDRRTDSYLISGPVS